MLTRTPNLSTNLWIPMWTYWLTQHISSYVNWQLTQPLSSYLNWPTHPTYQLLCKLTDSPNLSVFKGTDCLSQPQFIWKGRPTQPKGEKTGLHHLCYWQNHFGFFWILLYYFYFSITNQTVHSISHFFFCMKCLFWYIMNCYVFCGVWDYNI